jgi:O-antigen/teichoic acid export membrane protein
MLGVAMLHQATASADIFILGAIATAADVAHYGVAQKIATAFLLLHGAVTTAATPFMRGLAADRPLLSRYYHVVRRWTTVAALPFLAACLAAPHLLLGVFGRKYAEGSGMPLVLLSIAGFILVASGPAGSTLLCTGHARQLFRVTAAGAIALVACVALLSPLGVVGIAGGVLAGRLIGRSLLLLTMRRYAEIPLV